MKAILFDADGVVINPMLQFARVLESEYGITRAMTRGFFQGIFNECLTGRAELHDVLLPFLEDWGWPTSVDNFIRTWLATDDCPDHALLEVIQDLRRAGYLCGLATLQERNRAAYMRDTMRFSTLFDRLFFSCELGCLKPAPAYFLKIESALGLSGSDILLWDDDLRNIVGARNLGWQAWQYTSFPAFQAKVREIGL